MGTREPDLSTRAVVERIRARLPNSQTGTERRITDAMVDAFAPEFLSLQRRIDGVEQRLGARIDGLDAKIDRLGTHVIDRLGAIDAKLDRLLNGTDRGQTRGG